MVSALVKYSGLLTIVICWLFVVIPATYCGINKKRETFSFVAYKGRIKYLVYLGMIAGGYQILFSAFLLNKFVFLQNFLIPIIIFILGNVFLILTGLVNIKLNKTIHLIFGSLFYLLYSFGCAFLGWQIYINGYVLGLVVVIAGVMNLGGIIYLTIKRGKMQGVFIQWWAAVWSTVWIVSILLI